VVTQDRLRRAALFFAVGAVLLVAGKYLLRDAGPSGLGTIPLPADAGNLPPPVAGIACEPDVGAKATYRAQVRLQLFVAGQPVDIPADLGVVKDPQGAVVCTFWLHTRDTTGAIHVAAPQPGPFTLGQFFAVAGATLSLREVAGIPVGEGQRLRALVDGQELSPLTEEALRGIALQDGRTIVLEIGPPWATAR
jgi:hypothetical protein